MLGFDAAVESWGDLFFLLACIAIIVWLVTLIVKR